MSLLLDKRGHEIYITEDIMTMALERGYKKDEILASPQICESGEGVPRKQLHM